MIRTVHKLSAGLIAAALLCGSFTSLISASAAEVAASTKDTFRNLIYKAWENKQKSVSISSLRLSTETVAEWYYEMMYTDAEWFYVDSAFSYSTSRFFSSSYVNTLQISYSYSASDIPRMQKELDAVIENIESNVQPSWSDAEKVLYLHDYLAEHCEYDLSYKNNDAYTALVEGKTVCQGYALAMCILCRRLDIPCYAITSDELNHMWNVVCVDGEWYHCDPTYDDGAPDMLGHGNHNYVLQSDAFMQSDYNHAANDWNYFSDGQTIICESDAYQNAFWVGALDTVHPLSDGSWFYAKAADPKNVVYASEVRSTFNLTTGMNDTKVLGSTGATWPTSNGNVYSVCYICTEVSDHTVYYHDALNIYEMSVNDCTGKPIYTLTEEEQALGYIYGIRLNDDYTLTYQIMPDPLIDDPENPQTDAAFRSIFVGEPSLPFFPLTTTSEAAATAETTTTTTLTTTETTTITSATTTAPKLQWQMELIPPTKLTYTIGEQLDYSGAEASVYTGSTGWEALYYRVSHQVLPGKDFVIDDSAFDSSKEGTYRIYVTYAADSTVSAYFDVCVIANETTTETTVTTSAAPQTTTTTTATSTTHKPTQTTPVPVTTATTQSSSPKTTTTVQPETTTIPVTTTVFTTTTTTTTVTGKPVSTLKGDVNLDSTIDVSDAVLLARLLAGDSDARISAQGIENAKCSGDDRLDSADVIHILRIIAHLI